jgi:hypothetical protein
MTESDLNDLLIAAKEDGWCQECGLEHIAPMLARLLKESGREIPAWLTRCVR